MTVYMTRDRWNATHKDFKGSRDGQKAVLTITGIDLVEIIPATDERIDNTGYGKVA